MGNVTTGKLTACGCFINGKILPDQGLNVPFSSAGVPPKPDIPSIVNTIINMQHTLQVITNQIQNITINKGNGGGGGNGGGFNSNYNNQNNQKQKPPPQQKPLGFVQLSRDTEQVKVANPNNANQFVMVNQTKKLVMQDKATGGLWTWELGGD